MHKRILCITAILVALMLLFTACGSTSQSGAAEPSGGSAAAEPAESVTEQETDDSAVQEAAEDAAGEVDPYAWLGLQDMPKCNYLDIYSTNHYIQTCDIYAMSIVTEETKAADGINTYQESSGSRVYSIDGKVLSVNDDTKMYMESDMGSLAELAKEEMESAQKNGTNTSGRAFVGTGSSQIPVYSESGDTAEYEYYEYNYPEAEDTLDTSIIERYYMKDGDVFAIYTKTILSEDNEFESTQVIKSISGDIPEGTFDLPDLTGYEEYE